MREISLFTLSVILLLFAPAARGQLLDELPLDLDENDGAMAVVPTVWSASGKVEGYLPPDGFEARLVNRDHPETELVYPAGTWFLPPPGFYRVWAEGHWWVSPYPRRHSWGGGGVVEMVVRPDMVPGGKVRVGDRWAGSGHELVLLSANPAFRGSRLPPEMKRRRPAAEVGEGLMLAEGTALAGLWDEANERFVALSRPFAVRHETTVDAPLEVPEATAHLFVELRRDMDQEGHGQRDVLEPRLHQRGQSRPPDFLLPTLLRTYAVWYDLEPGLAVLTAHSEHTALPPEPLELGAGRVHDRRLPLAPRRVLDVLLDLPSPLTTQAVTLAVQSLPQGTEVARVTLEPGMTGHRFGALTPILARVELETSLGSFHQRVDLRHEPSSTVTLDPDLIALWGHVELDDEGHPASVSFRTVGGDAVVADTDPEGFYEVALLEPVRSVEVTLDESDVAPYVDFFSPPITADRELDFHLLDVTNRVDVVDARSGEPLPAARVTVRNEYEEYDDQLERTVEKATAQRMETDADGVALLAPFRQGSVEVSATAEGYMPSEPLHREVPDPAEDNDFRIALEPLGDAVEVHLGLPSGAPAVGAEVLLLGAPGGSTLFAGGADADGHVQVPRPAGGATLLIRHPEAGGMVRQWPLSAETDRVTWSLPPAAPQPLTLEVRTPSGEGPARQAEVALWLDAHRLSGTALVWLANTRPFTDPNGHWVGHNLPPEPLAVLAWSRNLGAEAAAGDLDTLATEIAYPWPSPAVVRAVR